MTLLLFKAVKIQVYITWKPGLLLNFFDLLARRTSGRQLIPEIDGLRTVALLSVVFYHANGNFNHYTSRLASGLSAEVNMWLKAGDYGVPLFFVISGFILALPFADHYLYGAKKPSVKRYFIRRLSRLEPLYLIALLVYFSIKILRSGDMTLLVNLFVSCTYLHNIVYSKPSLITTVAWSLEIEAQFYLLAPLLTQVFRIRTDILRRGIIISTGVVSAIWAQYAGVYRPIDGLNLSYHLSYFFAGFLLVDMYLTGTFDKKRVNFLGDLLFILGIGLLFASARYSFYPTLLAPVFIYMCYAGVFQGRFCRVVFRYRPCVVLGGMCYSIYLFHFLVIGFLGPYLAKLLAESPSLTNRLSHILIASIAAIIFSMVPYLIIEKPSMNPRWPAELWVWIKRHLLVRK